MKRTSMQPQAGFTLVELVVVIVLVGIIGGVLALQLGPTIQGYLMVERRTTLTSMADTALRRVARDVRSAVPNSLRLVSSQCLELVPTIDGGRYRAGPDIGNSAAPGLFLDPFEAKDSFDILTRFNNTVTADDAIVIGNQNTEDLYSGDNVAEIKSITRTENASTGEYRLVLDTPITLPSGYDGGRFVVVPGGQRSVTYVCTADNKTSKGNLYRVASATLNKTASCPAVGDASPLVATNVESCSFVYSPNQGATQESGFAQLQLKLTAGGESVSLTMGAHVDNVP